jgi:hypothetical protein
VDDDVIRAVVADATIDFPTSGRRTGARRRRAFW